MTTRRKTAPVKAPSQIRTRIWQLGQIPDPLLTRLLESISILEVYARSLDDEHAHEEMVIKTVIRALDTIHDEMDRLNMPTPAERLRMVRARPANSYTPEIRKQLIAEAQIEAKSSLQ